MYICTRVSISKIEIGLHVKTMKQKSAHIIPKVLCWRISQWQTVKFSLKRLF